MTHCHDLKCPNECVGSKLRESVVAVAERALSNQHSVMFDSAFNLVLPAVRDVSEFLLCTFWSFCLAKALPPPTSIHNQERCGFWC